MQVRAWDNKGGTITTWEEAVAAWAAGNTAVGKSALFTPAFDLGGGAIFPPNLIGLHSFNIAVVPEPTVFSLGLLTLAGLLFRRRNT